MFDKKEIQYEDLGLKIKNSVRDVRVALKSKKKIVTSVRRILKSPRGVGNGRLRIVNVLAHEEL